MIIKGGYNTTLYEPTAKIGNTAVRKLQEKDNLIDAKIETAKPTDKNSVNYENVDEKFSNFSVSKNLTESDQKLINELNKIEKNVIAHEQAHLSAGGGLVRGGAAYSYQTGPDGKRYIVGGEVQIDTSTQPDDPGATIAKMQRVIQAALAPADPSSQDRSVASSAAKTLSAARMELSRNQAQIYNYSIEKTSVKIDSYA